MKQAGPAQARSRDPRAAAGLPHSPRLPDPGSSDARPARGEPRPKQNRIAPDRRPESLGLRRVLRRALPGAPECAEE